MTPPRNAPCPCGSGTKYKKCCGSEERANAERAAEAERVRAWREERLPMDTPARRKAQAAILMAAAMGMGGRWP
jgi:hypothetical protein